MFTCVYFFLWFASKIAQKNSNYNLGGRWVSAQNRPYQVLTWIQRKGLIQDFFLNLTLTL